MAIGITLNGQSLDLKRQASELKYTKQIADIFDMASVSSSVTNSFSIPKTPNNTQIMKQLGLVGDTSRVPYEKVNASVTDSGFPVIAQGFLTVSETSSDYKISIADGMVDFFKAIDNKTMGTDLNLSQFNHIKDLETVIASFTGEYYKYIIADYNGKVFADSEDGAGINIDYLVPNFNVGKLLELVMETFGYSYDTNNIEELDDTWVTYPKNPGETISEELIAEFNKGLYVQTPTDLGDGIAYFPEQQFWDSSTVSEGTVLDNWRYVVPQDGAYRVSAVVEAYGHYKTWQNNAFVGGNYYEPINVNVARNGDNLFSFQTDPYEARSGEASYYLTAGDIIEIEYRAEIQPISYRRMQDMHHNSTLLEVRLTNQGNVILNDVFKDFAIKDFFKECLWRTATIPIINPVTKHIYFLSIDEYLDLGRADDWSDKYAGRIKETYIQGSYAQKNTFHHKYNDSEDISQDGYLYVSNQNLSAEKKLADSKIYAPENVITRFNDTTSTEYFETRKFTVWSRESKEDASGELGINYKGLSGRFYFMKAQLSSVSTWRLVSEAIVGSETVTQIPYADVSGTTFNQIISDKYNAYNGVLNNFRCHEIGLVLGIADFIGTDLTRPKYFGQEGQYYILNRLNYEDRKVVSGEFVRINRVAQPQEEGQSVTVSIMAVAETTLRISIPVISGFDNLDNGDSEIIIDGVTYSGLSAGSSDGTNIITYVNPSGFPLIVESFSLRIDNGSETFDYIYDGLPVEFTSADISGFVSKSFLTYKQEV